MYEPNDGRRAMELSNGHGIDMLLLNSQKLDCLIESAKELSM